MDKIIWLHQDAPSKPEVGQACNGCGVCCAAEPCPVARTFLWQWSGSCAALEWQAETLQYRCGMLQRPAHYLFLLPLFFEKTFSSLVKRWIAAGVACDSDAEVGGG